MSAALFVGRVGGLAVALGVGAAVFNGVGVASADSGAPDSGSRGATATDSSSSATAAPARTRRAAASGAAAAAKSANKRAAAGSAAVSAPSVAAVTPKRAAAEVAVAPEAVAADAPSGSGYVADPPSESTAGSVDTVTATSGPDVAPIDAQVSDVVMYAANGGTDGAGTGSPLVDSPLAWSVLAATRRQGSVLANQRTAAVTAATNAAATVTSGGITVTTGTSIADGIILGTLSATSAGGNTLTYAVQGSSCGDGCGVGTSGGKMTTLTATTTQNYSILPYANWLAGGAKGDQTFNVRVSEVTQFDKILTGIPLVGLLAAPIISLLQTTPFIGNLLAPIIGSTVLAPITANVATLAPGNTPVSYTYKVTSFDGTLISTNFFPASGLQAGQLADTVLYPPGLGSAGATNPYSTNTTAGSVPGISVLRSSSGAGDLAYNVITWDPRGEFQSGGILQLDNPMYEGRDTSAVIDWVASDTPANLNGANDPVIGMVGGSYGGGIQMTTVDPRLEAIVPTIAWNSLNQSLYPDNIFKTAWANTLGLSLLTTGARINGEIYPALIMGNLVGSIRQTAQAVLGSSGPTALLNQLQAPTLLVQGTVDALFPLLQSIENAQTILANPYGTPVKMIWFCGGHGVCLDQTQQQLVAQATTIFTYNKLWLDKYVGGVPIPDAAIPTFQWWDQTGTRYTSNLYPFSDGFNTTTPLVGTNTTGGTLGVLPFGIGGSGPNSSFSWPLSQVFATPASNAINVAITPTVGQQVVGAPTVSFTYSGLGTAKAVYAQVIDNVSGRVLGNIVTEVPVTLDGQTRTVSVPIADIAYTATTVGSATPSLTLQITGSASLYMNSAWGVLNVSNVVADLPVVA